MRVSVVIACFNEPGNDRAGCSRRSRVVHSGSGDHRGGRWFDRRKCRRVQFGLYISPVGFSGAIVPEKWRLLYDFNPMVGVIDGFRWAISNGASAFPQQSLLLSLITIAVLLVSGIWYFRKTERTFADVI